MAVNLEILPENLEIFESFLVANTKIQQYLSGTIMCSISGGADSDIMLDLLSRVDDEQKIRYVFFDTGLEYQATKNHLKFLEEKYGIEIEIIRAKLPIPTSCRKYGQPFISKQVSEWISRLQKHNFKWEDENFDTLYARYPKCKAALRWWCNKWGTGRDSKFNIAYNKWLKEFMIANPPTFKISNKCCKLAKKDVAQTYKVNNDIALSCTGLRKAEGGARSTIPNCFTPDQNGVDEYRPIFWYKNDNKVIYENHFGIVHSHCYTEYGLKRTGCAGCPFGQEFEQELEIISKYEPKLFKAVNKIFGDSYEYTRKYREFQRRIEG